MSKKILLTLLASLIALGSFAYAEESATTECNGEVCIVKPVKKKGKEDE